MSVSGVMSPKVCRQPNEPNNEPPPLKTALPRDRDEVKSAIAEAIHRHRHV